MQEYIDAMGKTIATFAPSILGALVVIIIGFWVAGMLTRVVSKMLDRSKVEPSLKSFALSLVSIGLKVMVIISAAGVIGVETTSFVAILGAASFAIGLALQGSLANFAGGALILFFKPYKIGDLVEAQGFKGVVQEIQIFTTVLAAPGGQKIIVPNGAISNGSIVNFSDAKGSVILDQTFGIGYTDDIDQARKTIKEVIAACPYINQDVEPTIVVSELADSSVNFLVRTGVTVETYWDAFAFMNENIKKSFDKASIGIPFPQMDVHVHNS
jgi:small conductance mechanosensitive channel